MSKVRSPNTASDAATNEKDSQALAIHGFIMLPILLIYLVVGAMFLNSVLRPPFGFFAWFAHVALWLFLMSGFFILKPNLGKGFTFFGSYAGSFRTEGFWYTNPFYSAENVSLKVVNTASQRIKVNEATGSPIEVECVVSWCVSDVRRALFNVEHYTDYLRTQIEAALRKIVSEHPYEPEEGKLSLRGNQEAISQKIEAELQKQSNVAGIRIIDARISHLAYAPEIAQMMLKRQQAQAVVQARQLLVEGAVGMVEETIKKFGTLQLELKPEEKSKLMINMMTVLLSDNGAQPVLTLGDH